MNRDLVSAVLACAFGAFIGAFLGLEAAQRFSLGQYLWPLTAIFGGITAYVAVDFGRFTAGIARAYRATIAWKPNRLFWKAVVWQLVAGLTIGTLVFLFFSLVFHRTSGIILGAFMFFVFGPLAAANTDGGAPKNELENEIKDSKSIVWNFNPIAVLFWMGADIFLGLTKGVPLIPSVLRIVFAFFGRVVWGMIKVLPRFVSTAFRYVHTQKRTLCFCDAALGAVVGYLAGSATIGALAGAVLGFVNYELVSVRWLKLVPAKRDV